MGGYSGGGMADDSVMGGGGGDFAEDVGYHRRLAKRH
jgi:hypothetical protein